MSAFSRLQIGQLQLDRALQLYLDERDYVPAITLASSADAIFDRLLEAAGTPQEAGNVRRLASRFAKRWQGYFRDKALIEIADGVRTGLGRLMDEEIDFEPDDVARHVLERAVAKQVTLTGHLSPRMQRFRGLGLDDARDPGRAG